MKNKQETTTQISATSNHFFVACNDCYGGFHYGLKREYGSVEEFKEALKRVKLKDYEQVALYEVNLAEDEEYVIDEYDGLEGISFRKKTPIQSTVTKIKL